MRDLWQQISRSDRCFIIAEIGVNHNGSVALARKLIDVAAAAGADAVKFQTFFAEELVTAAARQAAYQVTNLGAETSQFEMLSKLELTADEYASLKAYCTTKGIMFLSTPFSERAADLLTDIGVEGFKVSSGDLTHIPLLRYLATKDLPVILSSGMATLGDVELALTAFPASAQVAVLHCVSDYPTDAADCNLRAMATLRRAFGRPIGWSDHTTGSSVALAAVASGAQILEKHYTLDRKMVGPDHVSSLEPDELTRLVSQIRMVELAMGNGIKTPSDRELKTAQVARRSLTLQVDVEAGTILQRDHLAVRRPSTGIAPRFFDAVIGRETRVGLTSGACLMWDDLKPTAKEAL